MSRRIAWFSCGAASAVAAKIGKPDIAVYCDTGSEDVDNSRFLTECKAFLDCEIKIIKSDKYESTWHVWESKSYISGIAGAPCTGALKRAPREKFQRDNDVHIFGYTADKRDAKRFETFKLAWPELSVEAPLIERGINKEGALQLLLNAGIQPPRVYSMGYEHANCIPCPKASSPQYWALVRQTHPHEFARMCELSDKLNAKLAVLKGERIHIRDVPESMTTAGAIQPACDMMCQIAEKEIHGE